VVSVQFHAISEKGRRERNEDAYLAEKISRYYVFAVADGLGGHAAGDVASSIAIETLRTTIKTSAAQTAPSVLLKKAMSNANRKICEYNSMHGLNAGTTLVSILMDSDGSCTIGNVGDSRAFFFENGKIWQTTDHSYVQLLVQEGRITPDEAFHHPMKHILQKALGLFPDVAVDIYERRAEKFTLVVSSDGLHDTIRPQRIRNLAIQLPPDEATKKLVSEAMHEGSNDNISVIVVRFED
jgi:serine/threonine protein phosphatase PrpC